MTALVGLDVGTTGVKALAVAPDGEVVVVDAGDRGALSSALVDGLLDRPAALIGIAEDELEAAVQKTGGKAVVTTGGPTLAVWASTHTKP